MTRLQLRYPNKAASWTLTSPPLLHDHVVAAFFALTTTVCSDAAGFYAADRRDGLGAIPFLTALLA